MTDPYRHRDGCKYNFSYKKDNKYFSPRRSFILAYNDGKRIYGQFITSNWYKKLYNTNEEGAFAVFKVSVHDNNIKQQYYFQIKKDKMPEYIKRANNKGDFKVSLINNYHHNVTLILSFYPNVDDPNTAYIMLPNFNITL